MDLLTQGLLGATLAQAGARPKEIRVATAIGFLSGLLADADALIKSSHDPLLTIEFHRHFSHALVFIPVGALIASLILWPLFRKHISFGRLYFFSFLAYATSGLLDACTSYGTSLLWPFSDERIAWNIVSIVDPIFSFCLIIAIFIGWRKRIPMAAAAGMFCAIAYLLLGFLQHERAEDVAHQLIKERGHNAERIIVKPTMANQLLWRLIYEEKDIFYIDAIRVGYFGNEKVYQGGQTLKYNLERDTAYLKNNPVLLEDIRRFQIFSDDFIAVSPLSPDIIGDVRYSMLPTGLNPLWGIELNVKEGEHARFENYRDTSKQTRDAFKNMLLGKEFELNVK